MSTVKGIGSIPKAPRVKESVTKHKQFAITVRQPYWNSNERIFLLPGVFHVCEKNTSKPSTGCDLFHSFVLVCKSRSRGEVLHSRPESRMVKTTGIPRVMALSTLKVMACWTIGNSECALRMLGAMAIICSCELRELRSEISGLPKSDLMETCTEGGLESSSSLACCAVVTTSAGTSLGCSSQQQLAITLMTQLSRRWQVGGALEKSTLDANHGPRSKAPTARSLASQALLWDHL